MPRSLVTGGNGFIGRHLVSALRARGDFVRILDEATPAGPVEGVEFVPGSVLDRATVLRALDGIDHVYHLAAIAHLWTPEMAMLDRVNREGTEIMLSAAARKKVARFVHCASAATLVSPYSAGTFINETAAAGLADMAGPYSRSKYLGEQAALSAARAGQPVVVVNPTLPIGPGDDRLTPPMAMLALYFSDRMPASLNFILNLVDVRDVALGVTLAAQCGRVGERYILGGENISMKQLAAMLERLTGKKAIKFWIPGQLALAAGLASEWVATRLTRREPAATAEGVRLALRSAYLDSSKAQRELAHAPRPIGEAVANAVSWLSQRKIVRRERDEEKCEPVFRSSSRSKCKR
jgi:dihydroflavonol-4-reductase